MIGTTDVAVDSYDDPHIASDEIAYLLDLVNGYLERRLEQSDIVWSYSGVRPLYDDGSTDPSAVTRDYVLKIDTQYGPPGRTPVLSVFGGKITTYRRLAEHALVALAPYFPDMKPAWTRDALLPGGELAGGDRVAAFAELCARYPGIPAELLRALLHRHGALAVGVLGDARTPSDLGENFGVELTAREIDHFVLNEWARTAEDVLWRRTKCGLSMDAAARGRVAAYVASRAARS